MTAGRNLASKISAAYDKNPPAAAAPVVRHQEEFHHPELDRAIDELVERYKNNPPESDAVVQFLNPPPAGEEDTETEQELKQATGAQVACLACGELSAQHARFCAMCGTPLQRTVADIESQPAAARTEPPDERRAEERSSPYLLAAILILSVVVSWRSGWEYGLRVSLPQQHALPAVTTEHVTSKTETSTPATKTSAMKETKRPRASRAAVRKRTRQQPEADPTGDDDEVVWIRRTTGSTKTP